MPDAAPQTADRTAPTPLAGRSLAPDLARGMMLLFIALAHVPWFLYTAPTGTTNLHPVGGSIIDQLAQFVTIISVDARTWTMFAFLFAYGIGQLTARQDAKGHSERSTARLLRRRSAWLLAFGALHAVLLWQGDILGTYGLVGLIFVPLFLRRRDRTLVIWMAIFLVAALAVSAASGLLTPATTTAMSGADVQRLVIAEPNALLAAGMRVALWTVTLYNGIVTFAVPLAFLAGLLAARHRILDEPGKHLRLLRTVSITGITLGVAGALPMSLHHVGLVDVANGHPFAMLHFASGIGQGLGYAALFGLIAHALATHGLANSAPVQAVVALGRRSLSGYVAQSVLFMVPLAAWGFGLGQYVTSAGALAIAVATWLVTVVAAAALERAGQRGPAEVALRRLTYRTR